MPRTREQIDDFVLRTVALAGCRQQQFSQRIAARVEELGRREDLAKGLNHFLPGIVQRSALDLSLTGQDLPHPDVGLEDPHGVAAQRVVGNLAQALGHIQKVSDGCVVQLRKFGEDQILIAELCEPARQSRERFADSSDSPETVCCPVHSTSDRFAAARSLSPLDKVRTSLPPAVRDCSSGRRACPSHEQSWNRFSARRISFHTSRFPGT